MYFIKPDSDFPPCSTKLKELSPQHSQFSGSVQFSCLWEFRIIRKPPCGKSLCTQTYAKGFTDIINLACRPNLEPS